MLVVDASAVTELLLGRAAGDTVAEELRNHQFDLHAPHVLDLEVLSALRRLVAAGHLTAERAAEAIVDMLALPLDRHAHYALVPRIWELRENLTAYDATYVALAEAVADEGASLITTDARLARAASALSRVGVIVA
jgi:predicted nucleic acid-binding protein